MRLLVSAASKHGATQDIAEAIAMALRVNGHRVDLVRPEDVQDLAQYEGCVLGSGVYAGHWLAPARELVHRCSAELLARPVWLFSSGPVGAPLKPEHDAVDVSTELALTGARQHRLFGGRLDRELLGFAERAVVRALHVPEGDYRDWAEVRVWAETIAEDLQTGHDGRQQVVPA
jgi:menaquinone-dependent protoporphyrinogen oxidase